MNGRFIESYWIPVFLCNGSPCCVFVDQHCGAGEKSAAAGAASAQVVQPLWWLPIQEEPGIALFHRLGLLKARPVLCPSPQWCQPRAFHKWHQLTMFRPRQHKGRASFALPAHLSRPRDRTRCPWRSAEAAELLPHSSWLHTLLPCQDCLAEAP